METETLINKILKLFNVVKDQVEVVKSPYMSRLIEFIFKKPIFTIPMVTEHLKAYRGTSSRLVTELESRKIITELRTSKPSRKIYAFSELIRLL